MDRKTANFLALAVLTGILYLMSRIMMGDSSPTCATMLKAGYQALQTYAIENDERFPAANQWMSAAMQQGVMLKCDKVKEGNGYAFNDSYSSATIPGPSDTPHPLIYDSSKLGMNEHDDLESLPSPGRHDGKNNYIDALGSLGTRPG